MRVGWTKVESKPGFQLGQDDCSWAFDGWRVKLGFKIKIYHFRISRIIVYYSHHESIMFHIYFHHISIVDIKSLISPFFSFHFLLHEYK